MSAIRLRFGLICIAFITAINLEADNGRIVFKVKLFLIVAATAEYFHHSSLN